MARVRSHAGNRVRRGGQSQNRIQRLHDERTARYLTQIEEKVTELCSEMKGIVIMGPGQKKDQLYDRLNDQMKLLIRGRITISGTEGMENIMEQMTDVLESKFQESKYVEMFEYDLETCGGRAIYGPEQIRKALEEGLLQCLIVKRGTRKQWEEACQNVGCELVETRKRSLWESYGDTVGYAWYAQQETI
jgi:peptide subunit release factor 1 (eRF1)